MSRSVQVISFTIPWPAYFGGVIDVYYRLAAFKQAGIDVDLHCFEYDRPHSAHLESVCRNVFYYPRGKFSNDIFSGLPFIVRSRQHSALEKRILATTDPVLMEGLHSSYLLQNPQIAKRSFVRIHNIEHHYYSRLAKAETSTLKKLYFNYEANKLRRYENILTKAKGLACISATEFEYYKSIFGQSAFHLPAFHPYNTTDIPLGNGDYVLYHGNLKIAENHKAAIFLLKKVCIQPDFPLIIAGKSPRSALLKEAAKHSNVKVVADPDDSEMDELIRGAQVHVLPAFQDTGVKLKLLAALFRGRFVLTNSAMTNGTGLESICERADTAQEFHTAIRELMEKALTQEMKKERTEILMKHYDNNRNVQLLIQQMGI